MLTIKKYIEIFESNELLGADPKEAVLVTLEQYQKEKNFALINELLLKIKQLPLTSASESLPQLLVESHQKAEKDTQELLLLNFLIKKTAGKHYQLYLDSVVKSVSAQLEGPETTDPHLKLLLTRKNLPLNLFSQDKNSPKLSDDLAIHARWFYTHIHRIKYPHHNDYENPSFSRLGHNIAHGTRTAKYVPVFVNLLRKYDDKDALNLTDEDIKLIQIAALAHDAARESDGEDLWDHESAIFAYYYFTRILNVDKNKAKLIAEAIANKDISPLGYFEIRENRDGTLVTNRTSKIPPHKNIQQRLLQNSDCLDILRARMVFRAEFLDFMTTVAAHNDNAFDEMAQLITEARSLITLQGDTYGNINRVVKKLYENERAVEETEITIAQQQYPILYQLRNPLTKDQILSLDLVNKKSYEPTLGMSETNLTAAMYQGKIFSRGIVSPALLTAKKETKARVEVRKTMREIGVPTKSRHLFLQKAHNPSRSASEISHGSSVFARAGFLIINPQTNQIQAVSETDFDSGIGKKKNLSVKPPPPKDQIETDLKNLHRKLKMGGSSRTWQNFSTVALHTEILFNTKHYDAIYFTNDSVFADSGVRKKGVSTSHFAPILEAIFLQKEYEQQYDASLSAYKSALGEIRGAKQHDLRFGRNRTLPIFEYSHLHNRIREIKQGDLTEDRILKLWKKICSKYMSKEIKSHSCKLLGMSHAEIKMNSLSVNIPGSHTNAPADSNYSPLLQSKINKIIDEERKRIYEEHKENIIKKVKENNEIILTDNIYCEIAKNSYLITPLKEIACTELNKVVGSDLFDGKNLFNLFEYRKNGHEVTIDIFRRPSSYTVIYKIAKLFSIEEHLNTIRSQVINLCKQGIPNIITSDIDYLGNANENFAKYLVVAGFFGVLTALKSETQSLIESLIKMYDSNCFSFDKQYFTMNINNFKKIASEANLLSQTELERLNAIIAKREHDSVLSDQLLKLFKEVHSLSQTQTLTEESEIIIRLNSFMRDHENVQFTIGRSHLASMLEYHQKLPGINSRQDLLDKIIKDNLRDELLTFYRQRLRAAYPKEVIHNVELEEVLAKIPHTELYLNDSLKGYQQDVFKNIAAIIENAKDAETTDYQMSLSKKLQSDEISILNDATYQHLISINPEKLLIKPLLETLVKKHIEKANELRTMVKLYKLASLYKFQESVGILSKKFHDVAENILNYLMTPRESISSKQYGDILNNIDDLLMLVDFIENSQQVIQKLNIIIQNFFIKLGNDITEQRLLPPPLAHFRDFLCLLEKNNYFSAESFDKAKKVFLSLPHEKWFEDETFEGSTSNYFTLAEHLKIDIKDHFRTLLKTKVQTINAVAASTFLLKTLTYFPLNQDNVDLYLIILDKFSLKPKSLREIAEWVENTSNELISLVHEPNLSPRYLYRDEVPEDKVLHAFMKAKILKLYEDCLADNEFTKSFELNDTTPPRNANIAINTLHKSLETLMRFEYVDETYPLIIFYNKCINDLSNTDSLKASMRESVITAILDKHDKIPGKDKRQSAIDLLARSAVVLQQR